MLLQLAFVLIAIIIGARIGGIGLGVLGGLHRENNIRPRSRNSMRP